MCIFLYVYMHTHMYKCIYIHTHTYTHMYMHTCVHSWVYMYIFIPLKFISISSAVFCYIYIYT